MAFLESKTRTLLGVVIVVMAAQNSNKAIASGIGGTMVAFLTGLSTALQDGGVTSQEWVTVALATVIGAGAAFGFTWAAPANRDKHTPEHLRNDW